jgi:hypothetical protein
VVVVVDLPTGKTQAYQVQMAALELPLLLLGYRQVMRAVAELVVIHKDRLEQFLWGLVVLAGAGMALVGQAHRGQ